MPEGADNDLPYSLTGLHAMAWELLALLLCCALMAQQHHEDEPRIIRSSLQPKHPRELQEIVAITGFGRIPN